MLGREKLIELLMDKPFGNSTEEREIAHAEDVAEYLIANGVTVRERGRWGIGKDVYDNEFMYCRFCHEQFYDGENDTVDCMPNFCPNCGADMRPEGEGEEDA